MTALRKGWCPGALRPMEAKDGLLVRLRLTGGVLPAATATTLAELATRHGNGLFDLSARGNLQMRGVRDTELPALQDGLQTLGLLDGSAAAESVRNVIASPLAGLHGGIDIRPLVEALERRLVEDATLHALPGKFGFLIDDGSWPTLAGVPADVRFDWTGERFAVGLGGSRADAVWITACDAGYLVARAAHIARGFLELATRCPDARRLRDVVGALGPVTVADGCGGHLGARPAPSVRPVDGPDVVGLRRLDVAAPLAPHDRGESRQHRGSCWCGIAAPFGRFDATMLLDASAVASRSPFAEIRLTPWRVLLLPGIEHLADALPAFITDSADSRLSVAACVGATGCVRGATDTQADATALAASLAPAAGITLHVSGCEKGCAKPSRTKLALVAHDGRYDLVHDGRASDPPTRRGLDLETARKAIALELA